MSRNKGIDTLTDDEVQALYYSVDQPHLVRGALKAALKRARDKLENETFIRRRQNIYLQGRRDGFAGRPAFPVYAGHRLGSFETMTYNRGFEDGRARLDRKQARRNRA